MPTYEYKCEACGITFEKFQSITAAAIRKCPECKKSKVRRLIGMGAGLLFKGSGFYTTDYRSDSYKSAAKNDGPATKSDNGAKGDSKTPATSAAPGASTTPAAPAATPAPTKSTPAPAKAKNA